MKNIKKLSCMFATHVPFKSQKYGDVHFVKETVEYDDGTKEPRLKMIQNFQRPFWVTKENLRTYKEKKEYEPKENLIEKRCTESDLRDQVAYALKIRDKKAYLRQLCNSPYIYGADIPSTSLIKAAYRRKYPDYEPTYTVAMLDTETDVLYGTNEIILITIVFKNICYTVVVNSFIKNIEDYKNKERLLIDKYLSDKVKLEDYEFILDTATSPMAAVSKAFEKLHEWKPDLVAAWNAHFDITKLLETCAKYGVDPKDVFSDPSVPEELRFCKYKEGSKFKITASGKRRPKAPHEMWNSLSCPSSFYFIDYMAGYKLLRLSKAEEPSYALDAILGKELKLGKLKFSEADGKTGLEWHAFMQENYPLEYVVYNRFDSLSMQLLDIKNNDLSNAIPMFSGLSSFADFNSQPKMIANSLFYFLLEDNKVLATVGMEEPKRDKNGNVIVDEGDFTGEEDDDEEGGTEVLNLRNWIVTLMNSMFDDTCTADCIEENLGSRSNVRSYVYDMDMVGAYPSSSIMLNLSKSTTEKEVIAIVNKEGSTLDELTFRKQNINLLSGHVNALEYCTTMFNFPKPDEMLEYLKSKGEI